MEILLTVILIVYLAYLLGKFLLKRFVERQRREFQERFGDGYSGRYERGAGRDKRNEGDVDVVDMGTKEKKVRSQVGDYVEYEEVAVAEEEFTYEEKKED